MSVRTAELMMAVLFAAFSIYLMVKSAELPIGWIEDEGPGGGAWPFWLSVIMLLSCIGIVVNWIRRKGRIATSSEPYIDSRALLPVALVAAALIVTVALFHVIGVYGALPLFLLFYLKVLGRHTWRLAGAIAISTPVVTFFFFEILLKITLPKGVTETWFYPLYKIFL